MPETQTQDSSTLDTSAWDKALTSAVQSVGSGVKTTAEDVQARDKERTDTIKQFASRTAEPLPQAPAAEPAPKLEETSPVKAFGSFASSLAILGSLLTRRPLTTALNASATAMKAIKQGDVDAYDRAFKEWEKNSDYAFKTAQYQNERYRNILENKRLDFDEMSAMLSSEAAANQDEIVLQNLRVNNFNLVERLVNDRLTLNQRAQEAKDAMSPQVKALNEWIDANSTEGADGKKHFNPEDAQKFIMGFNPQMALESGGTSGTATDASGATLHGESYLQTLPAGIQTLVKALAEGRQSFPSGFALRSPYWQGLLQRVSEYDPSFDAVNYQARSKTRADFTSGQAARNVTSLNTVMGHLQKLKQAADLLNNNRVPAANSVFNWLAQNTGDPRVNNFETAKQAVTDELERTFRGTSGSVSGIKGWYDKLSANASPEQQAGAWDTLGTLLDSRIDALGDQYSRGMGVTTDGLTLLSPQAQAAYKTLRGFRPEIRTIGSTGKVETSAPRNDSQGATLPDEAKAKLQKGQYTTFQNGQTWTLDENDNPKQVEP